MKLVVGLGNPGPRYSSTRHNAGFRVIERFARDRGVALSVPRFSGLTGSGELAGIAFTLLEPHTFMNRSGDSVVSAVAELGIAAPHQDLLVVYDDMDLPLGKIRLRKGGGAGGQNGIGHVSERLGSREIPRIRFGIGRPPEAQDPIEYVLAPFADGDAAALDLAVARAAEAVAVFIAEGMNAAMNRYNAEPIPNAET